MGTATLHIWLTPIGKICGTIQPVAGESWYVHIVDCDGNVVEWCGRKYRDIETKCGFVEVEVPPGCYGVLASHTKGTAVNPPFGNRLTHVQVVRVNCGDHACVTLFSPNLSWCGTWFAAALRQHQAGLAEAGVRPEAVKAATTAIDTILKQLKPDTFTKNMQALQNAPEGKQ